MPLKLENAAKRVGNRWVYRDVSLEVADGEIFAIFGQTGSGRDELIRGLRSFPANLPRDSVLSRLFRGVIPSSTSNFERQSLAIDGTRGPLVLDNPLAGLDEGERAKISEKIRAAASGRRVPVVLSTPDFRDVLEVADRAAVIVGGYIRQTGTPRELYDEPASRAVAVLTGPHNLIEARRLTSSKSEIPEFQTIRGGHRLFTQKMELSTLGAINQNAWLAIRPEQVSLSFGASFPEDNLLKAVITGVKFRGSATYVCLDCDGLPLEAMVTRLVGLNPGDQCMAALPPDRLRVLTG